MIVVNGNTSDVVIFNGSPTTGILNNTVIWGVAAPPVLYTYTASGTLTSTSMSAAISNGNSTSNRVYYHVNSMSRDISATWINANGNLCPPQGTRFYGSSEVYIKVGMSAYSNRDSRKLYVSGLYNMTTATASPFYYLNGGISLNQNSGTYPSRTASGLFNLENAYANGFDYTAGSGQYSILSCGPTANNTTAKFKLTSTQWSATFVCSGV